jgi:predicted hydrocarbon binding protein
VNNEGRQEAFLVSEKMKGLIKHLGMTIGKYAGLEIQNEVMKGEENEDLEWFICSMEKLDQLVDKKRRIDIMHDCGHNCAEVNKIQLQKLVGKRNKYDSLDNFLKAQMDKPSNIMRIEQEGERIFQYYSPRKYRSGVRCFCAPWRNLPDGKTISDTWCYCSEGFVERLWEGYVGKPVKVELLESTLKGAKECKFEIRF